MKSRLSIHILTLFPSMFDSPFKHGVIARAITEGLVELDLLDIRNFSTDRHQRVDSMRFGGGPGMVLRPEPIAAAIESTGDDRHVVYLTPQGTSFTQHHAERLSALNNLTLLCGRYEGIDERIRSLYVDEEFSIGDYVLTGGEIPAMVLVDSIARLIPGVVGKKESIKADSHSSGLLEHPHYTRPREFKGLSVPEVLLSGNHANVKLWERRESLRRTLITRPEMLQGLALSQEERDWLVEAEPKAARILWEGSK